MSRPVCRTAWREAENRRVSPSSAQMITAVSLPIPYWRCNALQPGWIAAKRADLGEQGVDLGIQPVDLPHRDGHCLGTGRGQSRTGLQGGSVASCQHAPGSAGTPWW